MTSGAYAGIWAVDVRFRFRVQIRNPDEKIHMGLSKLATLPYKQKAIYAHSTRVYFTVASY